MREETVEEEISRRVDGNQEVEDIVETGGYEVSFRVTLELAVYRVKHKHESTGQLTQHEQDDNSDQHDSDLRLLLRRGRLNT